MGDPLTVRHRIASLLAEPRTLSSLAHDLRLTREDVEDHVRHLIRSARAAGRRVTIEPAKCRSCGYRFDETKITKPGKCPDCRGTRIYEPLIRIAPGESSVDA
jgi:predicted Zn-ribbon and HTH transcriptional regulator